MALPVLKEIFTREVVKLMSNIQNATFLDGLKNVSQYVSTVGDEAQAIHLNYFGVEPDVLINNTTYPIPIQELEGEDIVLTLDKYQTKATPITDDELYAATWDKMTNVRDAHGTAIMKNKFVKAIHALAPSDNTDSMPVLRTTGADDGTGRKRLVWADLVKLKAALDALQVPEQGRRLVLCTDHINDLLLLDEKFANQWYNRTTGGVYSMLGFDFYSYVANPIYSAAGAKKSIGAASATGDQRASIFFTTERAVRADGYTKMYYSTAAMDPINQRNLINFRHNFMVLPTREEGRGAIISGNVA